MSSIRFYIWSEKESSTLLLLLSHFSRVRLCDPIDGSPPGSAIPGILQARTLEWAAISFSNAWMHAKSLQLCPTLWPHRWQPTRLPRPWDSPGKNTGVGCHFLLQCMKVKSESEVAQSCLTLRDPMDCSLRGSSVHGISQARVLEWGAIAFSVRECKALKIVVLWWKPNT